MTTDETLSASGYQLVRPTGRGRRGAAMIMTVLLMVPLGVLLAYFMDAARLYVIRGRMQVAADAAALAGASGFLDGNEEGDSIQARAEHYVRANAIGSAPATLESLVVNAGSGTLSLVLRYSTGSLLLMPGGMTLRARSNAKAVPAQPGESGHPVQHRDSYGRNEDQGNTEATDSVVVKLGS